MRIITRIVVNCQNCGKEFLAKPWLIEQGISSCCSNKCKHKIRIGKPAPHSGGYKLSEQTKKILSIKAKEKFSNKEYLESFTKMMAKVHHDRAGFHLSDETKRKLAATRMCENNVNWKGDCVGYTSLHNWVKRRLVGVPKVCKICGSDKNIDLANISNEYKRDMSDWKYLCRRCHMIEDKRMLNLCFNKENYSYEF